MLPEGYQKKRSRELKRGDAHPKRTIFHIKKNPHR
jgi:hypothetical protein